MALYLALCNHLNAFLPRMFLFWEFFSTENISLLKMFLYWECFSTGNISLLEFFFTENVSILRIFLYWEYFSTKNVSLLRMFLYWECFFFLKNSFTWNLFWEAFGGPQNRMFPYWAQKLISDFGVAEVWWRPVYCSNYWLGSAINVKRREFLSSCHSHSQVLGSI